MNIKKYLNENGIEPIASLAILIGNPSASQ